MSDGPTTLEYATTVDPRRPVLILLLMSTLKPFRFAVSYYVQTFDVQLNFLRDNPTMAVLTVADLLENLAPLAGLVGCVIGWFGPRYGLVRAACILWAATVVISCGVHMTVMMLQAKEAGAVPLGQIVSASAQNLIELLAEMAVPVVGWLLLRPPTDTASDRTV